LPGHTTRLPRLHYAMPRYHRNYRLLLYRLPSTQTGWCRTHLSILHRLPAPALTPTSAPACLKAADRSAAAVILPHIAGCLPKHTPLTHILPGVADAYTTAHYRAVAPGTPGLLATVCQHHAPIPLPFAHSLPALPGRNLPLPTFPTGVRRLGLRCGSRHFLNSGAHVSNLYTPTCRPTTLHLLSFSLSHLTLSLHATATS